MSKKGKDMVEEARKLELSKTSAPTVVSNDEPDGPDASALFRIIPRVMSRWSTVTV